MFKHDDDSWLYEDDLPLFGGIERFEQRKQKIERAKEIASGLVMGTFERDEEVWEIVRLLKERK